MTNPLNWLQKLLDEASTDARDPEETCTRAPGCPGYAAVGIMQDAQSKLEHLTSVSSDFVLVRCVLAFSKMVSPYSVCVGSYRGREYDHDPPRPDECEICESRQAFKNLEKALKAMRKRGKTS